MFNRPLTHAYYIFNSLEECEGLIPTLQSHENILRYDSADSDECLKQFSYDDFWGVQYQSDRLEYEIFAYEFDDPDEALKYFINATGKHGYEKKMPLNHEEENKFLSATKGMISYEIIAVYQNKAYRLIAPKQYEDEINELLADAFSQKLS